MVLPFWSHFDADTLLSFLGGRAIAGVEEVVGGAYRRAVRSADGPAVVTMAPAPGHVRLRVAPAIGDPLVRRAARDAFDLDADPAEIDAVLSADPTLAPLVARRPGIRVPGTFDGFEVLIRAIYGQQVSVAGARTSLGRLAATFGTPLERTGGGVTHLFPSPKQIASIPLEDLGMPRARGATIRRVAELVDAGELRLDRTQPAEQTLAALAEVRGIGPWTLAYVAMRALRDRDAFIAGDLGVRRSAAAIGLPSSPKELTAHAERWRPFRAYAVMHLWHAGA
ncbi:MAG TPA: AlkA N-terminal domain-containing protein [Actinomycetota bacterium]|nr:AlkA N-terminal domain-containing protein [Actinomycetota bacterium]